jgi:hypothetical protein
MASNLNPWFWLIKPRIGGLMASKIIKDNTDLGFAGPKFTMKACAGA